MSDFWPWLFLRNDASPGLRELARQHPAEWPYNSTNLTDYEAFVRKFATASEQDPLLNSLRDEFSAWQRFTDQPAGRWGWIAQNFEKVVLSICGLLVAFALAYALWAGTLLQDLAQPGTARGLITFLFSVTTIAVALLIAVAIFWAPMSQLNERFSKAKDLLAILVGILGTIIGFYFGQPATTPVQNGDPVETAAPAAATSPAVEADADGAVIDGPTDDQPVPDETTPAASDP